MLTAPLTRICNLAGSIFRLHRRANCGIRTATFFSAMALSTAGSNGNFPTSSAVSDRYTAALVGGFVADAASMGLHWIYDPLKIKELVESAPSKDPAFFEPPSCPFYKQAPGKFSPYGAEAFGVLQALSSRDIVTGQELSVEFAKYLEAYDGYKNKASKKLIENVAAGKQFPLTGADDSQANALVKVPVAVARYSDAPDFLQKVEDTIRAHQNNDLAVRYGLAGAVILDRILKGSPIPDALAWAKSDESPIDAATRQELRDAAAAVPPGAPVADAVKRFGASCALPGALLVSLHVLGSAPSYEEAVRANILASGDQCSRGVFIGACFAAAAPGSVPAAWQGKVAAIDEVRDLSAKLLGYCQPRP